MSPIKKTIHRAEEYIRHARELGSIAPSSRFLTRRMTKLITDKNKLFVVELGPGTGVFTRSILKRLPVNGTLLAIEVNTKLADRLRKNITDSRLIVVQDGAEQLSHILSRYGFKKADIIISGLPLGNFSSDLRNRILSEIKQGLKHDGVYVQFQYFLSSVASILRTFPEVSLSFEPRNLPPAFIYTCRTK